MADGLVQVSPDSTGKKVDCSELTVGSNTVERQRMVWADPTTAANLATVNSDGTINARTTDTAGQAQYNFPGGFVRTSDEPRQVFYDPFDAALDTTNVWTTPTVGNSAVLASVTSGLLSMGTGTTASGWSKLFSLPTFKPSVPAWLGYSFVVTLPDGAAPTANSYRFWGAGTIPATPTTAAPLTDAVGFELTTAGKLQAVVYAAGVRTLIQDLSSTGNSAQPLNATAHRYVVYVRTDKAYWYIDSLATPVATSNFQSPAIQTLPATLLAVGGSTPPGSNSQIQCNGLTVWDTGKNATQLSDGTFPWRKATVSSAGALSTNMTQVGSTAVDTNSGTKSAGTMRVVLATDQPALTNPLLMQSVVGTTSGWTPSSQTALTNTKTQIKSSAGLLGGYVIFNPNAAVIYIQVWNVALASITVGTTAPTYVIPIPAGAAANVLLTPGVTHGTAICVAATTTPTGSTAPTSALVCTFLFS